MELNLQIFFIFIIGPPPRELLKNFLGTEPSLSDYDDDALEPIYNFVDLCFPPVSNGIQQASSSACKSTVATTTSTSTSGKSTAPISSSSAHTSAVSARSSPPLKSTAATSPPASKSPLQKTSTHSTGSSSSLIVQHSSPPANQVNGFSDRRGSPNSTHYVSNTEVFQLGSRIFMSLADRSPLPPQITDEPTSLKPSTSGEQRPASQLLNDDVSSEEESLNSNFLLFFFFFKVTFELVFI